MPTETLQARPEAQLHGERLYESFYDGLKLVAEEERKFAAIILGIDLSGGSGTIANLSLEELTQYSANLRDLYYGADEKPALHDAIINKALEARIAQQSDKYVAFQYPQLVALAKKLSRQGILGVFSMQRMQKARAARHYSYQSKFLTEKAAVRGLKNAAEADDAITFNHDVRDLINSKVGSLMKIDRTKSRRIIKTILMGDDGAASEIEQGIALEVATKRLLDRMFPAASGQEVAVFGSVAQDKRGGDIVLYPQTENEGLLDIKQTPPDKIRPKLAPHEINEPNFYRENQFKAYLWLGYGYSVGENYSVPPDYMEKVGLLMRDVESQRAIA